MARISDAKVAEVRHALARCEELNQNLFNLNYYLTTMTGRGKLSDAENAEIKVLIAALTRQTDITKAIITALKEKTEL